MKVTMMPLRSILTQRQGEPVDSDGTYPIAGVYGFGRGVLLREPLRGIETKYTTLTQLHESDVVYSKLKAFEAAITVVDAPAEGHYVSQEFPVFAVSPEINSRYLDHFLKSSQFLKSLAALSTGIGARRERVHPDRFLSLSVPIPSRADQDCIAAHLDSLARAGGPLSAERLGTAVEQLIQSVSAGAPSAKIGSIMEATRIPVDVRTTEYYRRIGVRGFGRGMVDYPATTGDSVGKIKYFELGPNRLVLSSAKAWEGAVAMTQGSESGRIASNNFLQYSLIVPGDLGYLTCWLLSSAGLAALGAASPGSVERRQSLTAARFKETEVPWPSETIQHAVAAVHQQVVGLGRVAAHRNRLSEAVLPAARNEVFGGLES